MHIPVLENHGEKDLPHTPTRDFRALTGKFHPKASRVDH